MFNVFRKKKDYDYSYNSSIMFVTLALIPYPWQSLVRDCHSISIIKLLLTHLHDTYNAFIISLMRDHWQYLFFF